MVNTPVLIGYFLNDAYIQDINESNVLGSKGELCRRFASLMKKIWFGEESTITPQTLKRIIGKVQT